MNQQELYHLIKNSKLSQVASPLGKTIRGKSAVPTHQIIFTPKSSAIRSNYGMKSMLPKQIGYSHIVYNDLDNYKNMPDVEKSSGKLYNRLKFQETGLVLKNHFTEGNPLFASREGSSGRFAPQYRSNFIKSDDSITNTLNLHGKVSPSEVKAVLKQNPKLAKLFKRWLVENHPQTLVNPVSNGAMVDLVKSFLETSPDVTKRAVKLQNLIRNEPSHALSTIQGTGGFSYNQKGRLANTPNGVKYGVIAQGRIVGSKEAAIGGFVAGVNERTTLLQHNYSKNYPGKHSRQFNMPFKVTEAELTESGSIKLYADGVRAGEWMQRSVGREAPDRSKYEASNPSFGSAAERNKSEGENLQRLLNLIIQ
jgi:Mitochondrial ribosomal protein subunit.